MLPATLAEAEVLCFAGIEDFGVNGLVVLRGRSILVSAALAPRFELCSEFCAIAIPPQHNTQTNQQTRFMSQNPISGE